MIKMNEEEFKNYIGNNIKSISSKISLEEINFLGNLIKAFNEVCMKYDKSQNNWNELKKWLEEEHKRNISWYGSLTHHDKQYYLYKFGITKDVLGNVQDKMQELEQGKDE